MRRDGAANRERILLAAEHVFGAGGTEASTEEVARRAEVGVATVFRHFPTKQDLLEATSRRYLEKAEAEIGRLADDPDPGRSLAAVVRALVAMGPTKATLLKRLLDEAPGLSDVVTRDVREIVAAVARILARAQAAGAARADVTVEEVFTLARALALATGPDQSEPVERALEIVLDGLGVRAAKA